MNEHELQMNIAITWKISCQSLFQNINPKFLSPKCQYAFVSMYLVFTLTSLVDLGSQVVVLSGVTHRVAQLIEKLLKLQHEWDITTLQVLVLVLLQLISFLLLQYNVSITDAKIIMIIFISVSSYFKSFNYFIIVIAMVMILVVVILLSLLLILLFPIIHFFSNIVIFFINIIFYLYGKRKLGDLGFFLSFFFFCESLLRYSY